MAFDTDTKWLFERRSDESEVDWPAKDHLEEFADFSNEIPSQGRFMPALGPTWWLLGDETPNLSDLYERAGESLKKFFDYYNVYPVNIDEKRKLFGARYEFPQANKKFIHQSSVQNSSAVGIIDFLTGYPMASTEMLVVLGQYSSRNEFIDRYADPGAPCPPIPNDFFEGYEEKKRLLNYIYIDEDEVEGLADPMSGEKDSTGLHWWLRINIKKEKKYPIPGEFLSLLNRPWVVLPWGKQESSPYIFSGEWMDTVFYSGAIVKQVFEETESQPYPTYQVQWRKHLATARPTDYAKYNVGDFVTILKRVPNPKNSQMWKDDDTKDFNEAEWTIAPLMFYGFNGLKVE
jgi:hypothetical protein